MSRSRLEVADIFRGHGAAWRKANAGHMSLGQLKVMSAIESCRTAALGGHVARCEKCAYTQISYNSCRNRHCPKCQGAAAKEWLAAREADLLPVPYYHVVFTLPAAIADIAYQNKAVIYDLLFKVSADGETRGQVMEFAEIFRGKVVDVTKRAVIIEITGMLLRDDRGYYCIEDVCTHDGQPLTNGEFSLLDYWRITVKRRWIVIATLASATSIGEAAAGIRRLE